MRNPSAARTSISTPRAGASLTKASIERTTPLICGSQASVMMRMRVNGNAGTYAWTDMDSARLHGGLADLLAGHRPPRRRHSIVQQLFHRLGGRISELSRSGDLNLLAARWLGSRNFAAVILSGRPGCGRADARLFSMLSTIPCACVFLTLCVSVIFATSSDVFTWLPQVCRGPARC